jgi:hypothetical protein
VSDADFVAGRFTLADVGLTGFDDFEAAIKLEPAPSG